MSESGKPKFGHNLQGRKLRDLSVYILGSIKLKYMCLFQFKILNICYRYVTFQRSGSHDSTPTSNDSNSPSSGDATPKVMSPTASMHFPAEASSITSPTFTRDMPPKVSSGYITVDEAMNKLMKASEIDPDQVNHVISDPRAYSRVTQINQTNPSTLVMSAKDLQVESRPPFRKVVTTVDGGNSLTKSTMV